MGTGTKYEGIRRESHTEENKTALSLSDFFNVRRKVTSHDHLIFGKGSQFMKNKLISCGFVWKIDWEFS